MFYWVFWSINTGPTAVSTIPVVHAGLWRAPVQRSRYTLVTQSQLLYGRFGVVGEASLVMNAAALAVQCACGGCGCQIVILTVAETVLPAPGWWSGGGGGTVTAL